jgi:hypothetical protein
MHRTGAPQDDPDQFRGYRGDRPTETESSAGTDRSESNGRLISGAAARRIRKLIEINVRRRPLCQS